MNAKLKGYGQWFLLGVAVELGSVAVREISRLIGSYRGQPTVALEE